MEMWNSKGSKLKKGQVPIGYLDDGILMTSLVVTPS